MSATGFPLRAGEAPPRWSAAWWAAGLVRGENLAISAALGVMMLLPLAEILVRRLFGGSIAGGTSYVQHMTLVVGMLGGAIAAREGRLLCLSSLAGVLKGRVREMSRLFSSVVAATVTLFLLVASVQFVRSEKQAEQIISYGIPSWTLEIFLPLGFALVALRIVWKAGANWKRRLATAALTAALVWLVLHPPVAPDRMVVPAMVVLIAATVLGAPIFAALGGAALILFWGEYVPIASIEVDHYSLVTKPTLPTVPLFTLAGYFLAEGGASRRLVRVFQALVGRIRGGPAILVTLVCAFFTSFTGASGVTILALGGLLMPVLLEARYSEKTALGLLTGTGSLGLLFPPCLPVILYAIIAEVRIQDMFLGGFVPGILLVVLTAIWGISQAPKGVAVGLEFNRTELGRALWDAKWELLVPVVAFVGLFSGWATPVEAAALTAFYTFLIESLVYRDLKLWRDTPRVMTECGLLVGGVLLILGVALGFTNYLVTAEIPTRAAEWVSASIHSPWMFLLLLNLFLIVVGALMDIYSAIFVVVPLIIPIAREFGIDPVHLGIIFLANAELGYLMPPVGENLFLSSLRFDKPIVEVFRSVIPMVVVFLVGVLLITYIPALTTTLPRWVAR